MKCIIIANGSICKENLCKRLLAQSDYIICADGGARHLYRMKILPHMIVGDLDSINKEAKDYFNHHHIIFYPFPKKKDYTDTELAIEYAIKKGATEITFLGVMGSRMDHTIGNITLLLPLLKKGIRGKIIDDHNEIIMSDKDIKISGCRGEYFSLIPVTQKVEITLEGAEYPLKDETLYMGSCRGVSNQFLKDIVNIHIKKGIVLIIKSCD